jgi:2-dehydro-3-deoxyphosphogluconate aldolase/(4S)-4-hydroxy-2-oxoglutarate aldolase
VKFIPLGGISMANARAYLELAIVAAIGGSWIADRKLIAEHQWSAITSLAAEAVALAPPRKPDGAGVLDCNQ